MIIDRINVIANGDCSRYSKLYYWDVKSPPSSITGLLLSRLVLLWESSLPYPTPHSLWSGQCIYAGPPPTQSFYSCTGWLSLHLYTLLPAQPSQSLQSQVVISLALPLIPWKLVAKNLLGAFVEMWEPLSNNLMLHQNIKIQDNFLFTSHTLKSLWGGPVAYFLGILYGYLPNASWLWLVLPDLFTYLQSTKATKT